MSRLSELYRAIETMRRENLATDDLEVKVSLLEEEIIKKEILPVLKERIEPALQPVQRELVLVVDYVPGKPLSVHLTRKRNFTAAIPDAKEMVLDPEVTHKESHPVDKVITRSPKTQLSVTFPDGRVIEEKIAADTFAKTIEVIGVYKVRQLVEQYDLRLNSIPLISNRRDKKYSRAQKKLEGNWLLMTHSNNMQKKKVIEKISELLDLGLKVEVRN